MTQYPYKRTFLSAALALVICPFSPGGDAMAVEYRATPPPQPQVRTVLSAEQISVEGSLVTPVSRDIAWAVLTDHEHFPGFVPGLQSSLVLETRGSDKIVAQRGEITAGPRLRYDGTMRVEEQHGEGLRICFLSGLFKDSEGEWRLTGDRPVTLAYRLRIDLKKSPLPPPLAGAIAEQQVRVWLSALASEMERRQTGKK